MQFSLLYLNMNGTTAYLDGMNFTHLT